MHLGSSTPSGVTPTCSGTKEYLRFCLEGVKKEMQPVQAADHS